MRKPKTVYMSRGTLTGQGATTAEAKAALDAQIDQAICYHEPFIEFRFGCVLFAAATACGWQSSVIFPDRQSHGTSATATCFYGWDTTRDRVIAGIRGHAAEATWTADKDDGAYAEASGLDEAGQHRLIDAFAWQRRYAAERDAGASENEARDIASGLSRSVAAA